MIFNLNCNELTLSNLLFIPNCYYLIVVFKVIFKKNICSYKVVTTMYISRQIVESSIRFFVRESEKKMLYFFNCILFSWF